MNPVTIAASPITGRFARFYSMMDGAGRREVNRRAIGYVAQAVRDYILKVAPQNHKTANSFTPPAQPTGLFGEAARNTIFSFTGDGGVVTVTGAGFSRAFHPLEIRAKGKMLTIPARTAPEAYGKTASQVSTTERLFLVKTRSGGAFLATGDESKRTLSGRGRRPPLPQRVRPRKPKRPYPTAGVSGIRPVFWLRATALVPQKRNILPSNAQLARATHEGYTKAFEKLGEITGTL